jgi:hypothetical protein
VGIGVDGVWLFSNGDGGEQRQSHEGKVEEGAHGGGVEWSGVSTRERGR